jgi:hypothetical protein
MREETATSQPVKIAVIAPFSLQVQINVDGRYINRPGAK